jgi:hypothetical protein
MSFAIYPLFRFTRRRGRSTMAVAAAVLAALVTFVADPAVAADDVFSVSEIAVDETADTAARARAKAFQAGQRKALGELLRRLTLRADHNRLPKVESERREFMVQALQVGDERTSNVRYLANMTVSFKPPEIRRLLREAAIPFAETQSKPVLVLPVLRQGDTMMLWDEANFWRDAWSETRLDNGLVPLILPVGDLADITDVDAAQAAEGDPLRLSAMASRYGAGDVLVAIATLSGTTGAIRVDIAASQIGDPSAGSVLLNFQIADPEAVPNLLAGAATGVVAAIEDSWKSKNVIQFDRPGHMLLAVPLTSLEQWVSVERRLNNVASISEVSLISLTRDSAAVQISHFGDESQLAVTLAQQDLALELPAFGAVDDDPFRTVQTDQALQMRVLHPTTP